MVSFIKESFTHLLNLLFDCSCPSCGNKLETNNEDICLSCIYALPRTNNYKEPDNTVEVIMAGRFPFERIATFCQYSKGGKLQPLIHLLKYKGHKEIGYRLGRLFGKDIADSNFINSIDYIIPVPLHKKRQRMRKYNQSEVISEGISSIVTIPTSTGNLIRTVYNPSQTKLSKSQRWENVEGIFKLEQPEMYAHKHILLVDDIITTGSTIEACAKALLVADGIKISVATIGEALQY